MCEQPLGQTTMGLIYGKPYSSCSGCMTSADRLLGTPSASYDACQALPGYSHWEMLMLLRTMLVCCH
jgi:hypothetical protein